MLHVYHQRFGKCYWCRYPIYSTDKLGFLRKLVLSRERGLDVEGALREVRWKGSFGSMQPESISLPHKILILISFDSDAGLRYDIYAANIAWKKYSTA